MKLNKLLTLWMPFEVDAAPTQPGIEFTSPRYCLHYTVTDARLHFTSPTDRLHFTQEEG